MQPYEGGMLGALTCLEHQERLCDREDRAQGTKGVEMVGIGHPPQPCTPHHRFCTPVTVHPAPGRGESWLRGPEHLPHGQWGPSEGRGTALFFFNQGNGMMRLHFQTTNPVTSGEWRKPEGMQVAYTSSSLPLGAIFQLFYEEGKQGSFTNSIIIMS